MRSGALVGDPARRPMRPQTAGARPNRTVATAGAGVSNRDSAGMLTITSLSTPPAAAGKLRWASAAAGWQKAWPAAAAAASVEDAAAPGRSRARPSSAAAGRRAAANGAAFDSFAGVVNAAAWLSKTSEAASPPSNGIARGAELQSAAKQRASQLFTRLSQQAAAPSAAPATTTPGSKPALVRPHSAAPCPNGSRVGATAGTAPQHVSR